MRTLLNVLTKTNFFFNFAFNIKKIGLNSVPFRYKVKINMPKPGFYGVRVGRVPGIYMTWGECEAQVKGFPNASYKKFPTRDSAEEFVGIQKQKINVSDQNDNDLQISLTDFDSFFSEEEDMLTSHPNTSIIINNNSREPANLIYPSESKRSKGCFYAVHRGSRPGVYKNWTECEAQIKNTRNASYRKFDNEEQALEYVQTGGIIKATKRELKDISYNNKVIKKHKSNRENEADYVLQNPDECVVVFTDGASAENGKRRARAGIGVFWGPNHPLNTSKRLPGRQTNNRAEIHAAIHALNQAKHIGAKKVKLYTDSQFLIHAITDWVKKWKRNGWKLVTGEDVVNKDDFIELEDVSKGLDVEWIYVKAHARHYGNEQADQLAVAGAKLLMHPSNFSKFVKLGNEVISDDETETTPFILTTASTAPEEVPLILPERKAPKVYYAVHRGKNPGVYKTWTECEEQIKDHIKPWFKKFDSKEEASEFVKTGQTCHQIKLPDYNTDEFITVFTDGASSCNGQEEAKAGIGVFWGPGNKLNTSMRLPGRQTNNRAEIFAAVHALRQAKRLGIKNLRLYTDSKFVINGITSWIDKWKQNDWKSAAGKPVINKGDFIALDDARTGINVDWCHVKGHANNPGNVEADKLAVKGCTKQLSETMIIA